MSRYGRPKMFRRTVFLWIRVADSPVIRSPGCGRPLAGVDVGPEELHLVAAELPDFLALNVDPLRHVLDAEFQVAVERHRPVAVHVVVDLLRPEHLLYRLGADRVGAEAADDDVAAQVQLDLGAVVGHGRGIQFAGDVLTLGPLHPGDGVVGGELDLLDPCVRAGPRQVDHVEDDAAGVDHPVDVVLFVDRLDPEVRGDRVARAEPDLLSRGLWKVHPAAVREDGLRLRRRLRQERVHAGGRSRGRQHGRRLRRPRWSLEGGDARGVRRDPGREPDRRLRRDGFGGPEWKPHGRDGDRDCSGAVPRGAPCHGPSVLVPPSPGRRSAGRSIPSPIRCRTGGGL